MKNEDFLVDCGILNEGEVSVHMSLDGGKRKRKKKVYTTPKKIPHKHKKRPKALLEYFSVDDASGKVKRLVANGKDIIDIKHSQGRIYLDKSLLKLSLRIIECDRFPSSMSKVCLNPTKFSNYVNLSTSLSLRMKEKFFFYFINF